MSKDEQQDRGHEEGGREEGRHKEGSGVRVRAHVSNKNGKKLWWDGINLSGEDAECGLERKATRMLDLQSI